MTVAVCVNVYTESKVQVEECLKRIRRNLSPEFGKVFVNGTERPDVVEVCNQSGFEVECGPNYGSNKYWNHWWIRMLNYFDEVSADICFKFDPDTMVDTTPKSIPTSYYFGDVWRSRLGFYFVQGGITGLSGKTVSCLQSSGLLEDSSCEFWMNGLKTSDALMDDQLIAIALNKLEILPARWLECRSRWRIPVINDPIRHAIVHPRYY